MSGAAKAAEDVKNYTRIAFLPYAMAGEAIYKGATKGVNPLKSVGRQAGKAYSTIADDYVAPTVGAFQSGAGMEAPEAPPSIAVEDPEVAADNEKKRRAKAARDTQVDILTDRPGRGGTILTDQYNYKV